MISVIKIGTSVVLSEEKFSSFVKNVAMLKLAGHRIVVVSSGAVGLGKKYFHEDLKLRLIDFGKNKMLEKARKKKIFASMGQSKLMSNYIQELSKYNLFGAQILLTKTDMKDNNYSHSVIGLIKDLLKHEHTIPIVNENDAITNSKNMFTDNDELGGMLSCLLGADRFIIITETDGVYDDFHSENRKIIPEIDITKNFPKIDKHKTDVGRGGMLHKLQIAKRLSLKGIETIIMSHDNDNLFNMCNGTLKQGTRVLASKKTEKIFRWK